MNSAPKPNFTAWFVMQGIIATMRHPAYSDTLDEAALALYQPLSDASRKARIITRITTALPYIWQHKIQELVTNPGRLRFFCFRKKEIEKQTRKLLSTDSVKQVVILGAGLDVLSLRLAKEYPAVKFIEIDTDESQQFKTAAFKNSTVALPNNVEFLAGDLRDPLSGILATSKFYDRIAKTIWIAEGFLMFVPEESVIRIFREIRGSSATGSYAIFTTIPRPYPGKLLAQWIQKYYMRKEKCPYVWTIPMENIKDFIAKQNYRLIDQISYDKLQKSDTIEKKQSSKRLIEDIHIVSTENT